MGLKLGINGLGRIGKLTLWNHVARKYFKEIVVNIGREVGTSLNDVAHYINRDSTYGSLQRYLYGLKDYKVICDVDDPAGTIKIDDVKVTVLRKSRNPKEINWGAHDVELVVDCTGQFHDPTLPPDDPKGSIRGHFESGAKKVLISAPFKIKDKKKAMPVDAVTTIMGINDQSYDPSKHRLISAGSCTTTCLAYMIKPLLDKIGAKRILAAFMTTIHAVTSTQDVLDRLPKSGATDLRKNRSILNNIILTTTGAADTLAQVLPEMNQIGFMTESVRVPITTGSLVILVVNIQEKKSNSLINKDVINNIYKQVAANDPHGYLIYSEEQNVSEDIISLPGAATVIEGSETRTRTTEASIDKNILCGIENEILNGKTNAEIKIPLTQAVIYGWYDNEMGGFVNMMGELTVSLAKP
ncbi:MAG: glyceraldehyde-3-phosphate dehydrogenase [Candidatus Mariimomonas ferrooxydans]